MSNDEVSGGFRRSLASILDGEPAQKFANEWRLADGFTLEQAACLWVGVEPKQKYSYKTVQLPPGFPAVLQMLHTAVRTGTLSVAREYTSSNIASDDDIVLRVDLVRFAESKHQLPAFLFDTVLDSELGDDSQSGIDSYADGPAFEDKQGGRYAQYDWNKIAAVALRIELDEGLPESFMEMCRRIQSFVQDNISLFRDTSVSTKAPDISQFQKKLGPILNGYIELRARFNEEKTK